MKKQMKLAIIITTLVSALILFTIKMSSTASVQSLESKSIRSKSLGVGFLTIPIHTTTQLYLYATITDKISEEIQIEQLGNGSWEFRTKIALEPEVIYGGSNNREAAENIARGLVPFPPQLRFRVLEIQDNYFKVVTNEEKWQTHYIKNNSIPMIYETWESFLKRVEFVELDTLKIYDKINGKVIFYSENENNNFIPFNVAKLQGKWIKINTHPLYSYSKTMPNSGWAKWQENNQLKIRITEETYE